MKKKESAGVLTTKHISQEKQQQLTKTLRACEQQPSENSK